MPGEWWLDTLRSDLSQGDVLADVPFTTITDPPKYLRPGQLQKNLPGGWQEYADYLANKDGVGHVLTRGKPALAVVVSHDCEIDKKDRATAPLLVAVVRSLEGLNVKEQADVMGQSNRRLLPLPGLPDLGDHYVDLRCITFLPKSFCQKATRVASMTDQARLRLCAQLLAFVTRLDHEQVLKAIQP